MDGGVVLKKILVTALFVMVANIGAASAQSGSSVTIGAITLLSSTPIYLAADKGYFRDAGVDVHVEPIDSTGSAMPLLASNRIQISVGGLSAAYWNALSSDMSLIMAFDAASSPSFSDLLVRTDLADVIKTAADLKGRIIGANAPGAIPIYQLSKALESGGLSLKDVTIKYIPFPQMPIALGNQALDVAEMSPPLNSVAIQQKVAVHWKHLDEIVRPQPVVLAAFTANTDWIKQNRDQARRVFTALGRAAREFCQAYHHGPNRGEIEDVMVKYKTVRDKAMADSIPWTSRDPNGRINVASVLDIQDVFFKEGLTKQKFPASRLVDGSIAEEVAKQLGPFEITNKNDKSEGCR
jgi:NitT/TauT family transport system substrate-binding protein